jgi:hypothetical protein
MLSAMIKGFSGSRETSRAWELAVSIDSKLQSISSTSTPEKIGWKGKKDNLNT